MNQKLQTLSILSEDPGLGPSTHMTDQNHRICFVLGIQHLILVYKSKDANNADIYRGKTLTNIKLNQKENEVVC